MAKAKKIAKTLKAKKEWYEVLAPKSFDSQLLCETLIGEPEKAIGRIISLNLMALTGDMKKQNSSINFKIVNISEKKAHTEITGYRISTSATRRMVRRGKNKIDITILAATADKKDIVVKLILITRNFTYLSVLSKLRHATRDNLVRMVSKINYDDLIGSIIGNKIQMELKKSLNKIYPVQLCEIRYLNITKDSPKAEEAAAEVVAETPAEEVKEEVKEEIKTEEPVKIEESKETPKKIKKIKKSSEEVKESGEQVDA
jgi:small subunit ribosomal protein S3Ae